MKTLESIVSEAGGEEGAEARRWLEGLEAVAVRLDRHFARSETRERLPAYLRGLLSPTERKNSWQLAEAVGGEKPYGHPTPARTRGVVGYRTTWSIQTADSPINEGTLSHKEFGRKEIRRGWAE